MNLLQRILLLLLLCSYTLTAQAATRPSPGVSKMEKFYKKFPGLANVRVDDYLMLSPKEYEHQSRKKLKWKEKLVYKVVKYKLKKNLKRDGATEKQRSLGWLSFFLGILALGFVFIPTTIGILSILFAIGGLVLGIKSLKGNSNTPGLIGLILSSAVLFIVILAVIALSGLKAFD